MASKIVEIASYPKCGNTWLRYIFGNLFDIDPNHGIPDIHQKRNSTVDSMAQVSLNHGYYRFYKSHILDNPEIDCDKIVLIYRNPLDVFFSSLNYFALHEMSDQFLNGIVKPIDKIVEDQELQIYFQKYCDEVGSGYFAGMLGRLSNYESYLRAGMVNPKIISVKYEDLTDNPGEAVANMLKLLFPEESLEIGNDIFDTVDKQTKYSNNSFFWKAKKDTHREYLSEAQITSFYKANPYFKELGY